MKENKLVKSINILLCIFMVLSVLVSGIYLYYHYAIKPNHLSVGVNYFGKQSPTDLLDIDNLSEEKKKEYEDRVLFEFNFYDNSKSNGIPLCEFRLNYFTDYTMTTPTCRSVGLQGFCDYSKLVDIESLNNSTEERNEIVKYFNSSDTSFYMYTFQDDLSWAGYTYDVSGANTVLNNDSKFIVSIANKPYLIQLNGKRIQTVDKKFLFFTVGTETTERSVTWTELFIEIMYAVRTNSQGYGSKYFVFDCSDYFKSVKEYNPETKKFDKTPDTDITKNYSYVKFNYSKDGATKSSQSLFGLIKSSATYGETETSGNIEYWQSRVNFNIDQTSKIENNSVINYRYSDVHNGYLASVNLDCLKIIKDMPTTNISVVLDLDKLKTNNLNVVGLDISAFENFKLNSLTIKGTGKFYLLKNSLINTEIKTIKKSSAIELIVSDEVFNSDYKVVNYE